MSDRNDNNNPAKCFIIPQRVILAIMCFLAIVNGYTSRLIFSMVITKIIFGKYAETISDAPDCQLDNSTEQHQFEAKYNWSQELQSYILGSFYVGYTLTHIPGGILADEYGGKWVLNFGVLLTAICTMLTPFIMELFEAYGLIVLRFLMGAGGGIIFPAFSALISHWVPLSERGRIGAFIMGGSQVGATITHLLSGIMLHYFEWPFVFYLNGLIAILWIIIFTIFCYSTPAGHPYITAEEKEYLNKELFHYEFKKLPPTPWLEIINCQPVYALVGAKIGHGWGFYVMITYLPKYLNDVLRISIESNGLYAALPSASMWVVCILCGFIGDFLVNRKILSLNQLRKFSTAIAGVGPAIFMLAASYANCNKTHSITFFTLCMATMGFFFSGVALTPIDLSPNYAGTIMGIANGFGAITGFVTPWSVTAMTKNATVLEWRAVFAFAFCMLNASAIIFCIWGSAKTQYWNEPTIRDN